MMAAKKSEYADKDLNSTADVLAVLTGFATYDALAAAGHSQEDIIAIVDRLAHFATSSSGQT